jgi:hypothetical protein
VTTSERPSLVWYGLLAAPLAWAVQLALGYFLQDAGCPPASSGDVWGIDVSAFSVVVLAVCAVVALAGIVAAWVSLRAATGDVDPRGRRRFMAVAGLLGSALFLLAIALSAVAFVPLSSCTAG